MNIWTKYSSLALSFVFLISCTVTQVSAAFTDVQEIEHSNAVEQCTELNIISGFPDGSFYPTNNLTRAEMCKMLCVVLNGGKVPTLGINSTPTFSDVRRTPAAWAESYIEECNSQGIVSGVGSGRFNPDGNVTLDQASKMLLVALGYEEDDYIGKSWSAAVQRDAKHCGFFRELDDLKGDDPLTRDDAAQLIWNALQAKTVDNPNQTLLQVCFEGDGAQEAVRNGPCYNLAYRWIMQYTVETAMQAYEQITMPADTVEVSIDRKDFSIKNEDGTISAQMYYDLPYVTGSGETIEKINVVLREDLNQFEVSLRENDVYENVNNKPSEGTYFYTVTAEVTHNADGVLSIRHEIEWFMGGVRNIDHYGMTFDLETGEELAIQGLIKVSPDVLLGQLQPRILHEVTNSDDSAVDTVARYTLDDLAFYIRDRELWVCIPTYELGPGSAGSFEIPCKVYIAAKNPQKVDGTRLAYGETPEDNLWTIWEYEQFSEETTTGYQTQYIIQFSFSGNGDCTIAACYWETDVIFLDAAGQYTLGPDGILSIEVIQNGETITAQFMAEAIDEDTILLTQMSGEGLFFHHEKNHQLLMKRGNFDMWLG